MTVIEYDEMGDDFYAECTCGWTGRSWMHSQDADREAEYHDALHLDGVI